MHVPEVSAWTEWKHQAESVTSLSTGATFATNRGAEQGDVHGTIQSALVLAQVRDTHLGQFTSNPLEAKGVCDDQFVDEEQVLVRPIAPGLGARPRLLQRQELRASGLFARAQVGVCGVGHAARA